MFLVNLDSHDTPSSMMESRRKQNTCALTMTLLHLYPEYPGNKTDFYDTVVLLVDKVIVDEEKRHFRVLYAMQFKSETQYQSLCTIIFSPRLFFLPYSPTLLGPSAVPIQLESLQMNQPGQEA